MDTGGYTLRFREATDAEQAMGIAIDMVQARAQGINIWGGNDATGSWASGLVRQDATLFVPYESPIHDLEYGVDDTPQGDTIFQRICVMLASSHPRVPFEGTCVYRTHGGVVGSCGTGGLPDEMARDALVEQTTGVAYDGHLLEFEVELVVEHPDGRDFALQYQVWEHNEHGFFARRAVEVPRFCALHDVVSGRLLRIQCQENPYCKSAPYLAHVLDLCERGCLRCVGQTQEGFSYGCTFASVAKGSAHEGEEGEGYLPAVCLVDPRGRELLIASTPVTWRGPSVLPTWVSVSPDAELLLWEVSGFVYLWDGLRVRKVVP